MNYSARVEGDETQNHREGESKLENLSPDVRCDSNGNTTSDAEKSTIAKSSGWSFIKDREEKTVDPVRMLE